jgi:hypothetical protein
MSKSRFAVFACALVLTLIPPLIFADEAPFRTEYALSWTAGLAASYLPGSDRTALGGNEYLFLEARVVPGLSLGIGTGIFGMSSGPGTSYKACSLDLGGRLFPLRMKWGEAYLMGGMGYNPLYKVMENHWAGRFHASAGAGMRKYLGPGWAMDMGADYHFFTPVAHPVQSFGLKAGITLFIGGNRTEKNELARLARVEKMRLAAAENERKSQEWNNWYKEYQMHVVALRAKVK